MFILMLITFPGLVTGSEEFEIISVCPDEGTCSFKYPTYLTASDYDCSHVKCSPNYLCCRQCHFHHPVCVQPVKIRVKRKRDDVKQCPRDRHCQPQTPPFQSQCDSHQDCQESFSCCFDECHQKNACRKIYAKKQNKICESLHRKCNRLVPFQYYQTKYLECYGDDGCSKGEACCSDDCYMHRICKEVGKEYARECPIPTKKQLCPWGRSDRISNKYKCQHDDDCKFGNMCCDDGCYRHKVCKRPLNSFNFIEVKEEYKNVIPRLVGCPMAQGPCTILDSLKISNKNRCLSDSDCGKHQICCPDVCAENLMICKEETVQPEDVECPAVETKCKVPYSLRIAHRFKCTADKDCYEGHICCPDTCVKDFNICKKGKRKRVGSGPGMPPTPDERKFDEEMSGSGSGSGDWADDGKHVTQTMKETIATSSAPEYDLTLATVTAITLVTDDSMTFIDDEDLAMNVTPDVDIRTFEENMFSGSGSGMPPTPDERKFDEEMSGSGSGSGDWANHEKHVTPTMKETIATSSTPEYELTLATRTPVTLVTDDSMTFIDDEDLAMNVTPAVDIRTLEGSGSGMPPTPDERKFEEDLSGFGSGSGDWADDEEPFTPTMKETTATSSVPEYDLTLATRTPVTLATDDSMTFIDDEDLTINVTPDVDIRTLEGSGSGMPPTPDKRKFEEEMSGSGSGSGDWADDEKHFTPTMKETTATSSAPEYDFTLATRTPVILVTDDSMTFIDDEDLTINVTPNVDIRTLEGSGSGMPPIPDERKFEEEMSGSDSGSGDWADDEKRFTRTMKETTATSSVPEYDLTLATRTPVTLAKDDSMTFIDDEDLTINVTPNVDIRTLEGSGSGMPPIPDERKFEEEMSGFGSGSGDWADDEEPFTPTMKESTATSSAPEYDLTLATRTPVTLAKDDSMTFIDDEDLTINVTPDVDIRTLEGSGSGMPPTPDERKFEEEMSGSGSGSGDWAEDEKHFIPTIKDVTANSLAPEYDLTLATRTPVKLVTDDSMTFIDDEYLAMNFTPDVDILTLEGSGSGMQPTPDERKFDEEISGSGTGSDDWVDDGKHGTPTMKERTTSSSAPEYDLTLAMETPITLVTDDSITFIEDEELALSVSHDVNTRLLEGGGSGMPPTTNERRFDEKISGSGSGSGDWTNDKKHFTPTMKETTATSSTPEYDLPLATRTPITVVKDDSITFIEDEDLVVSVTPDVDIKTLEGNGSGMAPTPDERKFDEKRSGSGSGSGDWVDDGKHVTPTMKEATTTGSAPDYDLTPITFVTGDSITFIEDEALALPDSPDVDIRIFEEDGGEINRKSENREHEETQKTNYHERNNDTEKTHAHEEDKNNESSEQHNDGEGNEDKELGESDEAKVSQDGAEASNDQGYASTGSDQDSEKDTGSDQDKSKTQDNDDEDGANTGDNKDEEGNHADAEEEADEDHGDAENYEYNGNNGNGKGHGVHENNEDIDDDEDNEGREGNEKEDNGKEDSNDGNEDNNSIEKNVDGDNDDYKDNAGEKEKESDEYNGNDGGNVNNDEKEGNYRYEDDGDNEDKKTLQLMKTIKKT